MIYEHHSFASTFTHTSKILVANDIKNISENDIFIFANWIHPNNSVLEIFLILFQKKVPIIMWQSGSNTFRILDEEYIRMQFFPAGITVGIDI